MSASTSEQMRSAASEVRAAYDDDQLADDLNRWADEADQWGVYRPGYELTYALTSEMVARHHVDHAIHALEAEQYGEAWMALKAGVREADGEES